MANTKLSLMDPAGRIALSAVGETYIPALGNGTAKPGDAVGITDATGQVVGTDIGASEMFVGFLMPNRSDSVDVDTAIVADVPCEIVVPKSGHTYSARIVDPSGAVVSGLAMGFSATAGALDAITNFNTAGARFVLTEALVSGDVYTKVRLV